MPIYEYEIIETGEVIEFFQKMSDEHLTECPTTARRIRRIISLPVVRGEPQTIGGLAEKNSKKMSKSRDPRIQKSKDTSTWWRDEQKPNLELAKLNKKQKINYIKTGKING